MKKWNKLKKIILITILSLTVVTLITFCNTKAKADTNFYSIEILEIRTVNDLAYIPNTWNINKIVNGTITYQNEKNFYLVLLSNTTNNSVLYISNIYVDPEQWTLEDQEYYDGVFNEDIENYINNLYIYLYNNNIINYQNNNRDVYINLGTNNCIAYKHNLNNTYLMLNNTEPGEDYINNFGTGNSVYYYMDFTNVIRNYYNSLISQITQDYEGIYNDLNSNYNDTIATTIQNLEDQYTKDYEKWTETQTVYWYNQGKEYAYEHPIEEGNYNTDLWTMLKTISTYPIQVVTEGMNVDIFGINIGGLLIGLFTIGLLIIIIKLIVGIMLSGA